MPPAAAPAGSRSNPNPNPDLNPDPNPNPNPNPNPIPKQARAAAGAARRAGARAAPRCISPILPVHLPLSPTISGARAAPRCRAQLPAAPGDAPPLALARRGGRYPADRGAHPAGRGDSAAGRYAISYATGRCATQRLARVLCSKWDSKPRRAARNARLLRLQHGLQRPYGWQIS